MNLAIESMAVDFPRLASHPNRAPFRGVLTLVDIPSDRAPAGAGGHRVLLARHAVERALPSLLGMALDYAPSLDRHDAQRKVGIITEADIESGWRPVVSGQQVRLNQVHATRNRAPDVDFRRDAFGGTRLRPGATGLPAGAFGGARLQPCRNSLPISSERASARERSAGHRPLTTDHLTIAGFLYARDFPQLIRELKAQSSVCGSGSPTRSWAGPRPAPTQPLGMSYEIAEAKVEDMSAAVWRVTEFTFTGAAILRRDKAAYGETWIELV